MITHPCTGHVAAEGFGAFLERELGAPRRNLQAFARELSAVLDAPPFDARITLVGSGSSANLAAARALSEGTSRRRAIVSAFTFPTTVSALLTSGLEPTFVDVGADGMQMDPEALERAMTEDVAIVAPTCFLGWPAPLAAIAAIVRPRGARVLLDACETLSLTVDGLPLHRFADATTYSFYHPHHLSSHGGGAVVTRDPELSAVIESVVHWGRACTCHLGVSCPLAPGPDHQFTYVRPGFNLEMSELNACFGRFSLLRHREDEARRSAHWSRLDDALPRSLSTWPRDPSCSPFVFPIALREGDARPLVDRLLARGVEARSWMGGVIADQPAFRALPTDGLPRARALARRAFFVGIHQTLADEAVADVARILAEEA